MKRQLVAGFVTGAIILLARIIVVGRYGTSLPFWDQWGAESMMLYRPLQDGTFDWSALWQAHSEHRIFFTRIWAIALFYANQMQWDGMVQSYANALLVAVASGAASAWAWTRFDRATHLVFFVGLVLATTIPVGWENTIVGFQSCFYFVAIFSLLALTIAATATSSRGHSLLLAGCCLAAYMSLGSGLLAVPAALMVLFLRYWKREWGALETAGFALPLLIVFVVEIANTPLAVQTSLHAESLDTFANAFLLAGSWPLPVSYGLLIWVPFLFWLTQLVVRRVSTAEELVLGAVAAWILLVAATIAYSRGSNLLVIESRYVDTLMFGILANFALAMRLIGVRIPDRFGSGKAVIAVSLITIMGAGFYAAWDAHAYVLVEHSGRMRLASANIARYLEGDRDALLNQPIMHIPVAPQEAEILGRMLDDPIVRSYLPFSIAPQSHARDPRICHWTADHLSCSNDPRVSSKPAIGVGPLSAVSYEVWKHTAIAWKKQLQLSSEGPREGALLNCQFEMVNEKQQSNPEYQVRFAAALRVDGWAGPRSADNPLRLNFVSSDGRRYAADFMASESRVDVADFLDDRSMAFSGFHVWVDASALPRDTYVLSISSEGSSECTTGRTIKLTGVTDARLLY